MLSHASRIDVDHRPHQTQIVKDHDQPKPVPTGQDYHKTPKFVFAPGRQK
jgi:hypothetical protein